jgi:hypothetical protein
MSKNDRIFDISGETPADTRLALFDCRQRVRGREDPGLLASALALARMRGRECVWYL